ncbi:C40 family peptidase [Sphingomonas sp. BK069]|uniref:C40 family peptidase n=1 Tax=Sphingomonas sp. BK069 TaxID=2586979 RepID=UPI00180A7A60|nr:C40 family peptidase [Sphingomonas sp. BK069]MBB3347641.1 cell wall-associated NlpC family hydrolase [Sphingomonas sp. BK069]
MTMQDMVNPMLGTAARSAVVEGGFRTRAGPLAEAPLRQRFALPPPRSRGGSCVLAAARSLIGVRFRAQGRDPALGLDCVGLVAVALARAGAEVTLPRDYRLRRGTLPPLALPPGLVACDGARPGDVLLLRVSPAQLHLALRAERGLLHADNVAGRVVERPGEAPWPLVAAWRWRG